MSLATGRLDHYLVHNLLVGEASSSQTGLIPVQRTSNLACTQTRNVKSTQGMQVGCFLTASHMHTELRGTADVLSIRQIAGSQYCSLIEYADLDPYTTRFIYDQLYTDRWTAAVTPVHLSSSSRWVVHVWS